MLNLSTLKNTVSGFAILALSAVAISPSLAQANDGLYVGVGAGINFPQDSDMDAAGINHDVEYDEGWGLAATLGYHNWQWHGFRPELELAYRANDIDSVNNISGNNGEVEIFSTMLNAIYDINTNTSVTPYLGVGAGGAWLNYDDVAPVGGGVVNDDSWTPAVQAIAGVDVDLSDTVALFANYNYLYAFDGDVKNNAGQSFDSDYDGHSVMVGLRFNFGAPEKPVAPKPAPAPVVKQEKAIPNNYLVFFDFDRSELTPEAMQIISIAAQNFKAGKTVRIDVTGHADRAGSDAYNLKLSERRARVVRSELVRQGISSGMIKIAAKGESNPLIATDDGVREPQNRRVEIIGN